MATTALWPPKPNELLRASRSPDGNVRGMKVQKMMLGEPDEKGRRKPVQGLTPGLAHDRRFCHRRPTTRATSRPR